ncbi:MAG: hypothetical protein IKG46_01240 [Solobacterium sp.]|nr:hypothetical protein [Solobacterium sp.]
MSEENRTPETGKKKTDLIELIMQNRIALVVAVIALVIFAVVLPKRSGSGRDDTIVSPFGQEPIPTWVTLANQQQAEIVAEYPIHYPVVLEEKCNTMEFNVFGKQIIEIQFKDSSGKLKAVAAKGKGEQELCGDKTAYRKTEIIDVGDLEVTTKGNNDTISLATWYDGEYSYYLGVQNHPVSTEEMEALVKELY